MKLFNTFVLTAIACACVATASDDVLPKHKTIVVKKVHLVDKMEDSTSGSDIISAGGSEASDSNSGSGSEEEWSSSDSFVSSSSTSGSDGSENMDSMSDILDDDVEVIKVVKVKKDKHNVKALPVDITPLPTHTMQSSTPPAHPLETSRHPALPIKSTPHPTITTAAPISHMVPEIGSAEEESVSESASTSGEDSDSSSGDSESDNGSDLLEVIDSFLGSNLDAMDDEIGSLFGSTSDSDSMDDEITFPVDPLEIDVQNEMKNEGADALTMTLAVGCIVGFIAIIVVAIIAVKKNAMYSSSILGGMATETNANSTEKAIDGSDEEASTEDALEKGEGAPLTSRSVRNGDNDEIEGKFE